MPPERLQQIEDLYHAVRECGPKEGADLLAQADSEVRREVEALLAQGGGDGPLARPAMEVAADLMADSSGSGLAVGSQLGRYQIEGLVGAGGMGKVYKARDTVLGRYVAVKTSNRQFGARFEREARAISALNHPHICQLHDVGPNYLVMELVEGVPLQGPMPVAKAVEYAGQILDALEEAHSKGIIHRDLKPGNILLGKHGIKLLDFGLAKSVENDSSEETATIGVMGTPAYMAPEQWAGKRADARSDLYAFGCVLYEMLTGKHVSRHSDAPLQRDKVEPTALEAVLKKCLAVEPAERWQSAADVRTALSVEPSVARKYGVTAAAALVLIAGAAFLWRAQAKPPLTDKDVLILADFTNPAGDPVFDGTLREALAFQIEESPFLKVLSNDGVRAALTLMGRPPDERITNDLARDMCRRENHKATIGGSLASLGSSYAITLVATNCQTGDTLAREQAESPDKEHVLAALAQAAKGIRGKLGESLPSMQKLEPLDPRLRVTTTSLEAFQLFAQGRKLLNASDFLSAIPLFKRATEIDPNFAIVWDYLAMSYNGGGGGPLVREHLARAFALRDRVSERERSMISSHYYFYVQGDYVKAAESARAWVRTFPRENAAHNFRGVTSQTLGATEEALEAFSEAYRIEPHTVFSTGNLTLLLIGLDRLDDAKKIAETALAHNPEEQRQHRVLLQVAILQDDQAAATREIQWFSGKPSGYVGLQEQSIHAGVTGRLKQQDSLLSQANALRRSQSLPPVAGRSAQSDALMGNCDPAGKAAAPTALTVALCGDQGQAVAALKEAESRAAQRPENTLINLMQLPMFQAVGQLKGGHPDQAVQLLDPLRQYERRYPEMIYLRGLCYLAARKTAEAAAEFQKIVDRKNAYWGPFFPAASLSLAQAAALAGDTPRARAAYQKFLALWKDADPDVPLLAAAKKEYAALH